MDKSPLPLGKLPPELLSKIISNAPINDPRLLLGPGIGLDCAVINLGDNCLVFKSDPITFASEEIGWYVVQINANDIATTGAVPSWFMVTALLPEGSTTAKLIEEISQQIYSACRSLNIDVIGGHTEITYGIDRPILAGTMIGEVTKDKLITPRGAQPGDSILLTKGVPIEGTAILAKEFPERLKNVCSNTELDTAKDFLYNPGISIVKDAQVAVKAGTITAMHDPTEGGVAGALWELAEACGHTLVIEPSAIMIHPIAGKICKTFGMDPLATIASGSLLLTCYPGDSRKIRSALIAEGIPCNEIGHVKSGKSQVLRITSTGIGPMPRPVRDEIARVYEA